MRAWEDQGKARIRKEFAAATVRARRGAETRARRLDERSPVDDGPMDFGSRKRRDGAAGGVPGPHQGVSIRSSAGALRPGSRGHEVVVGACSVPRRVSAMPPRRSVLVLGSFGASVPSFRGPLIRAMVQGGHRVDVAAEFATPDEVAAVEALGARVHELVTERHGMNPLREMAYVRRLRGVIQSARPDVVLAYTAKPVAWGVPAARAAGVERVVALVTGLGFAFTDGGGWRRVVAGGALAALYRRALGRCSVVVFQNRDDREELARLGVLPAGIRTEVVGGSGIDLDVFGRAAVPPSPAFLMIARLLGNKGVREYARASAMLARKHPSVPFRLAGWFDDGPDAVAGSEMEAWQTAGIEYVGRLEDVRPALAQCSCYVLPSYREGTPRTVLEAMATGRAIVTTEVPGCRQTVEVGANGFLVPTRDPFALAAAMERFVLEPGLAVRMGEASRRLAEERFDVRMVNRVMLSCLGLDE